MTTTKGGHPFFTFSARLAQPRGQHPPHHQHHLHQCPPWMRMMQAMPGMLSTMGTPQKTLVFDSAGSRSKNDPFSPKTHPNILSPLAARSQRKSIAHGRRMVGAWSAAVGGTGRPALYLKVGPPGLGLRPYHGPRGLKPPGGRIAPDSDSPRGLQHYLLKPKNRARQRESMQLSAYG